MSRLAAVTTGQPTQGMGTVPTAAKVTRKDAVPPAPTRQYASPLEAQRAEAEAAEKDTDVLDEVDRALDLSLDAPLSSRDPYSAVRTATTAAWLALSATELEVRSYFRKLPVPSGLEMLAKMRKQCDLAAETLQGRMDEQNTERCTGCGKTLEEARKSQWIMVGSDMDPDTGVPVPYHFCGPLCVRERNRKNMLPKDQRDKLRFDGQEEGDIR
jgi:hypothetical protein